MGSIALAVFCPPSAILSGAAIGSAMGAVTGGVIGGVTAVCYGENFLDGNTTVAEIASKWGFLKGESSLLECQNIAEIALDEGYNVIKVYSYRDAGINYVIYDNFDEILQPQMVTPIGD